MGGGGDGSSGVRGGDDVDVGLLRISMYVISASGSGRQPAGVREREGGMRVDGGVCMIANQTLGGRVRLPRTRVALALSSRMACMHHACAVPCMHRASY